MSKNTSLPMMRADRPCAAFSHDLRPLALQRWNPDIRAAVEDDNTISILDVIGYDWWTGEGVTAKRISAALRSIGRDAPVTVYINSPGGDMFEGMAIYNLLREHGGEVTVKVIGLAASAASVIAMAGDRVEVGLAGFLMIHNAWIGAWGNRHELREVADTLEPFDRAMGDVYAARTGASREAMQALMDAETWIGGSDAVEQGFADGLLARDEVTADAADGARASLLVERQFEAALRRSGLPASQAKKLISEFKSGLRDAAGGGARDATGRGQRDAADFSDTAAIAASLTNILG